MAGTDPYTGESTGAKYAEFGSVSTIELKCGMYFDRLGDPDGRYVCPSHERAPIFSHAQRGLPYFFMERDVQNEPAYHRYKVICDFSKLKERMSEAYVSELQKDNPDIEKSDRLELALCKLENVPSKVLFGDIAACFGNKGGGQQYLLPCTVQVLLDACMVREE